MTFVYEVSKGNLAACIESMDCLPTEERKDLADRIRKEPFSKVVSQTDGSNFTEIEFSSEPPLGVSREDVFCGWGIASFVRELPYIGEYPLIHYFAKRKDFPNSIYPNK